MQQTEVTTETQPAETPKASERRPRPERQLWSVAEWCHAAGISETCFYDLPEEQRPLRRRIGVRAVRILESPRDWLLRVGR
jgi:predicted DNA-binding transcriptional regulator AlpA